MDRREFGAAEPILRAAVEIVCLYEVVALATRRLPSVSRLARRYPPVGAAVLAGLAWHFQPLG